MGSNRGWPRSEPPGWRPVALPGLREARKSTRQLRDGAVLASMTRVPPSPAHRAASRAASSWKAQHRQVCRLHGGPPRRVVLAPLFVQRGQLDIPASREPSRECAARWCPRGRLCEPLGGMTQACSCEFESTRNRTALAYGFTAMPGIVTLAVNFTARDRMAAVRAFQRDSRRKEWTPMPRRPRSA